MRKLLAALALLAAPLSAAGPPAPMPAWLAGAWAMEDGQSWADEFWTPPRGEIMIGAARTGAGRQLQLWESTRIQRKADGSLSLFAQPRGAPAGVCRRGHAQRPRICVVWRRCAGIAG